jgi:NADH-quinone oxidoreductase subunit E
MNNQYDMLSQEALAKIDREVAKYPADQKQSAVMAALVIAQDEKGWLPQETIAAVAAYLGMAPIAAYEVASFYNMYDLHPVGKFTLKEGECMGACGDAPVMLVNNKRMCSFMLPEQIDKLLAECK